MRALITGGTGFVGSRLVRKLDHPVVLTRDAAAASRALGGAATCLGWQPLSGPPPAEAFENVDVVFNLMGESIGEGRWTAAKKKRIRESRIEATRNLVAGLRASASRPKVLVAASATGFYGDRGDEELDEKSPGGGDFVARVCKDWEETSRSAEDLGMRVVVVRSGIVFGRGGGALPRMALPFKLGAGGPLASGRQWMSWIHVDDSLGLLLLAAERSDLSGPLLAVAPGLVRNRDFSRTLGSVLHRPAFMPAPRFMLRIVIGEFTGEILASRKLRPRKALEAGYEFRYPDLEPALREALGGL